MDLHSQYIAGGHFLLFGGGVTSWTFTGSASESVERLTRVLGRDKPTEVDCGTARNLKCSVNMVGLVFDDQDLRWLWSGLANMLATRSGGGVVANDEEGGDGAPGTAP